MCQITSIIIVVDYLWFGECLASALTKCECFTVLAVAQTSEEALQHMRQQPAEIVLIEEPLPNAMALHLTQQITHDFPNTHVLLLGAREIDTEIQAYIEAGARGYIWKDTPFCELQSAIAQVARGEAVCSPRLAYVMFARLYELTETSIRSGAPEPELLSDRELEILQCMTEGWSNRQIADYLCLSQHTVKNHVHNILKKLRVQRRLEAIKYVSERPWFKKKPYLSSASYLMDKACQA